MKNISLLAKKLALLFEDTIKKRRMEKEMRIQTENLNRLRRKGSTKNITCTSLVQVFAEARILLQKTSKELKKLCFKTKSLDKRLGKRIRSN